MKKNKNFLFLLVLLFNSKHFTEDNTVDAILNLISRVGIIIC